MKRGRKGYGTNYAVRVSRKGQVLLSQEFQSERPRATTCVGVVA